ncbi:unnamed protein product [Linum trigynum]|uniref:F-box domain-containing protein n=1 Tax=Linum trigynum TaxID=586398 RepID=A0AAV2DQN5_9ROSI
MSSPSRELPDELVLKIISHLGTVNEIVRCSSLLSKRWRNTWRSIGGGVLEFHKSDELRCTNCKEQYRFANLIDQALTSLADRQNLDGLRIGFNLCGMTEEAWRWVEFGLTKRAKELTLMSYCYNWATFPLFTPEFLAGHDLSRLQILEFKGIAKIDPAAIAYILSRNCPSLRRFALRDCRFSGGETVVIRVCSSNNLEMLSLEFKGQDCNVRIELSSAPSLRTFKFHGASASHVEFGNHLPRLREAWFGGQWILDASFCRYLPLSSFQFHMFAPRLDRLGLELGINNLRLPPPEWLLFEKLRVLDLFIHIDRCALENLFASTDLLMAAPVLHQLSIHFINGFDSVQWESENSSAPESSTWKHHSLEVLQLHGVHRLCASYVTPCRIQLELAAYIITNTPSLNQVLIDTRDQCLISSSVAEYRDLDQVEGDICEAKMEMETQLQGRSASSKIHFTYR